MFNTVQSELLISKSYIVCFKRGKPKCWEFQKEGETLRPNLGRGKPKGGDFNRERGDLTFQVEFRDRKGQKWGVLKRVN